MKIARTNSISDEFAEELKKIAAPVAPIAQPQVQPVQPQAQPAPQNGTGEGDKITNIINLLVSKKIQPTVDEVYKRLEQMNKVPYRPDQKQVLLEQIQYEIPKHRVSTF